MKIDLLYFDGCPSWESALKNLKLALQREGISAHINMVCVKDDTHAANLRFLGSPSFQTDGEDWWPEERTTYSMSCRVYHTPAGLQGAPTVEMLQEKLRLNGRE